ncbi:MAG TPA: Clp protease N-terminal domain-containing protein [Pirellulaceae bacterium]|nr:Clp protease N-terminal domain-containing protein [Pirellulaceae bacterium]
MAVTTTSQRRPFQFRIWHLLWCMTLVCVWLAVSRLPETPRFLIVFIGSELFVVVMGTAHYVLVGPPGWRTQLRRGFLAGSCIAGLCFGWYPLMLAIVFYDLRPLLGLFAVVSAGAALGLIIGLVVPPLKRWLDRPVPRQPVTTSIRFSDRSLHRTLDRATDRVLRVLAAAKRCAAERNHDFVTPEHLLWALGTTDRGVARLVLESLGVDLARQASRLAMLIAVSPADGSRQSPTLSPQSERVLDLSLAQAKTIADVYLRTKQVYLGTEHLILGILAHGDCLAAKFLQRDGLTLERYRGELLKILGYK